MSWMDSWSRPSKSQATPPPYYLLPGGDKTPYCHRCGRIIGDRKTKTGTAAATPPKYCSSRCKTARHDKKLDQRIEDTFVALMNGLPPPGAEESLPEPNSQANARGAASGSSKKKKKGESRVLVDCGEVEKAVFGDKDDPDKKFGRRKNRARRGVKDGDVWKSVDMVSDDGTDDGNENETSTSGAASSVMTTQSSKPKTVARDSDDDESSSEENEDQGGVTVGTHVPSAAESGTQLDPDVIARLSIRSGTRIRPSQEVSEVNGGVGGEKGLKEKIVENEDMLQKRREGQKKADQRELVRCAARRGVAFGFVIKDRGEKSEEKRLCEAVMQGKVVESSFAKGEWGIRWRE